MRCAECGTQQPPGSVFCGTCGAPLPADTLAAAGLARPISSGLTGQLVVESGAGQGREFQVQGTMRIGRTADNEIALDDSQISRHHAAISREADGFSLEDLGSTNGTFLNGGRIVEQHHLKDGDRIRVGNTTLAFHWMPTPTPMPTPVPTLVPISGIPLATVIPARPTATPQITPTATRVATGVPSSTPTSPSGDAGGMSTLLAGGGVAVAALSVCVAGVIVLVLVVFIVRRRKEGV